MFSLVWGSSVVVVVVFVVMVSVVGVYGHNQDINQLLAESMCDLWMNYVEPHLFGIAMCRHFERN